MTVVELQLHGYKQGHQLLAASVELQKADQSVIDRLSDVAGPLRPKEVFSPYLTAYPLPSGEHYVLAKTWQDLTVARAGCVRTLSLIISANVWAQATSLIPFMQLFDDELPQVSDVLQRIVPTSTHAELPKIPEFQTTELLEALFLEDPFPIAVFDAPDPDVIAIRLLTALWPTMRKQFAISTFALSPRKVAGREFDLVFSPKNARSKFSDWEGRRIDGRSPQVPRHRWTPTISEKIFKSSSPCLLSPSEIKLIRDDSNVQSSGATLRISLLWNEMLSKIQTAPAVGLGLVDIANSGKLDKVEALRSIEPTLIEAIKRAAFEFPENDAWEFLGAIARKTQKQHMTNVENAIAACTRMLAGRAPAGAMDLLANSDYKSIVSEMLPNIAQGIAINFDGRAEKAIENAEPMAIGLIISQGGEVVERLVDNETVLARLVESIPTLNLELLHKITKMLLPVVVEDRQAYVIEPLLDCVDKQASLDKLVSLGMAGDFAAVKLTSLMLKRAKGFVKKEEIISRLLGVNASARRDSLIVSLLSPSVEDLKWLLNSSEISPAVVSRFVFKVVEVADDSQLLKFVTDSSIGGKLVKLLVGRADLALRVLLISDVPIELFVRLVELILPRAKGDIKLRIAKLSLQRVLPVSFGGDELAFITDKLKILEGEVDIHWLVYVGLGRNCSAKIVNRNFSAFGTISEPGFSKLVRSISEICKSIVNRRSFDLDADSIYLCSFLLFKANELSQSSALNAAAYLLPTILHERRKPVSSLVAVAFPLIYRELAENDDVPELFKFLPFFDWDRCKTARHELVSAFLTSVWEPGHLALAAWRAEDAEKILRFTKKQPGGEAYLRRVAADLQSCPAQCQEDVKRILKRLGSDFAAEED